MTLTGDWPFALLTIVVGVLSAARVTRLLVDDDFPPVARFRYWAADKLGPVWSAVLDCSFCIAPYVAFPAVAWGATLVAFPDWTFNEWAWWLVNSWAALSYLLAMVNVRDLPPDQR